MRSLIHIEWLLTKWRKYVKNAPTIQIEKSYAANIPSPAVIVPFVRGKKFYELWPKRILTLVKKKPFLMTLVDNTSYDIPLKKALTYIFDNFQLEKSKETVADNNVLVGIW